MSHLDLPPLPPIPANNEIVLVSVVKNELSRLSRWLAHYRGMGVRQFILIDNDSTDGTTDFLSAQRDVSLLRTTASFASARYGMDWVNAVRSRLPKYIWSLFVDADEYLVYDGWPVMSLHGYLGQVPPEANAVLGFMLDMYPMHSLDAVSPGDDLMAKCNHFDRDYLFRRRPRKPWEPKVANIEFVGGPRVRMLSSFERESRTSWFDYFVRGQLDRLLPITPRALRHWLISVFPKTMPALKKTPMLRGDAVRYINNHDVGGATYAVQNCVLLHYKFTAELQEKVRDAGLVASHYRDGAEYVLYQEGLEAGKVKIFDPEKSLTFSGVDDLLRARLIRDLREVAQLTFAGGNR